MATGVRVTAAFDALERDDWRARDLLDLLLRRRSLTSGRKRDVTNGVADRPRGTVTFLFTDVEGSTRLLKQLRDQYGSVLEAHQRLLREAFAAHGGEEVDTQGDAFFYVFSRARDAASAAADGQRALAAHDWPEGAELRVRMGLHTGEPNVSEAGRYHGMGVHRTARIMATGHGGQILASQATASVLHDDELDGITLRDLGEHKLKDLERPERIYELRVDGLRGDFPSLKTEAAEPIPLYRRPLVIGGFAGVLAAAIAIPVFAFGGGSSGPALAQLDANSVGIVDPASGDIQSEVADVPAPTRATAGANAIWVTSTQGNTVSRIEMDSHQVSDTIPVGNGPTGIAFGAGKIWVANSLDGTVSRIDPDANGVGAPIRVGNSPTAVAFGEDAVWVTNVDDRSLSRIDPVTLLVRTMDVGAAGRGVAVGAGAVWVSDSAENRLVRIDPRTGDVTQAIGVGSGPSGVAVGSGAVWVANTLDGTLSKIDPQSNSVRAAIPVGSSPGAVAANADGVWVANEAGGTVVRVDPRSDEVVRTVRTGARPTGLVLAGSLWVAAQASQASHRGGTLVVEAFGPGQKHIDTATNYDPTGWNILTMTNDGLVGFRHAGGSDGTQLVPDLATSLPAPTDGGRTYTFQLRKGIRFSTGAALKASDVRSTIERVFKAHGPRADYYAGIVGGSSCAQRPKTCDLSRGIVVDDVAGTVAFHLSKPDAEFLYKLAIPFAYVLPAGTPVRASLLPATGPYRFVGQSDKHVSLARNSRFRVWSEIAKPNGYPNEIDVRLNKPFESAAADVDRGRSDFLSVPPGQPVTAFANQHPAQVHATPSLATFYIFLNTTTPPFDNLDARRAVAYAVDRRALVQLFGGEEGAQPTCQVLPPNLAGYRPYCPFTLSPTEGGAWTAPDLAKARALVRASGTSGAKVAYWFFAPPPLAAALQRVFSDLFTSLGYRPSIRYFADPGKFYPALAKSRSEPQAGLAGWIADYPAPSTFFGTVSCSYLGDAGTNSGHYCSKPLDRDMLRALALQSRDPAAASRLWTQIDRDATDSAAIVPTHTPRTVDLVSKRVGNYQHSPVFGALFDQLWVK
jgi:peptide/nickel transport system substrate-binding protein